MRREPCGSKPKKNPCHKRNQECESQDQPRGVCIDRHVACFWKCGAKDDACAGVGHDETDDAANTAEHYAFGNDLSDHPATACPHRHANSYFRAASCSS